MRVMGMMRGVDKQLSTVTWASNSTGVPIGMLLHRLLETPQEVHFEETGAAVSLKGQ
jgi:hypothetical protein